MPCARPFSPATRALQHACSTGISIDSGCRRALSEDNDPAIFSAMAAGIGVATLDRRPMSSRRRPARNYIPTQGQHLSLRLSPPPKRTLLGTCEVHVSFFGCDGVKQGTVLGGWVDLSVVTLTSRGFVECHYPYSSRANTALSTTVSFVVKKVRIVSATWCLVRVIEIP